MAIGLVGRKRGMTRVFTETGESVPVTVIEVMPNRITQLKTLDNDGYTAIQVTTGEVKLSRVSKPMAGHFAKAGVDAGYITREFTVNSDEIATYKIGDSLTVKLFEEGQSLDVQGVTKGKGFAGVIKRHHFTMQDATHGNSLSHRAHGSTGQRQTPGRVWKGKKMAGHLGSDNRTALNQKIVKVDEANNVILLRGAVAGAPGGFVMLKATVKKTRGGQ